MKSFWVAGAIGLALVTLILVQGVNSYQRKSAESSVPRFDDYPAFGTWNGTNPGIVKDHTFARQYRTRLSEVASGAVNFSQHYRVGYWGCGMECLHGGVVNLNTGHVVELPGAICCYTSLDLDDPDPVEVRINSNLLIMRGKFEEDPDDRFGEHYYVFNGEAFTYIHFNPVRRFTYEDYKNDFAPTAPKSFGGYECTDDCSGHKAGYLWAQERAITNRAKCRGKSRSFIEGCWAYVEEGF